MKNKTDSLEDLVVDAVLCAYGGKEQAEFARLVGDLLQWLDHWDGTKPATYRIPALRMHLTRAFPGVPSLVFIWKRDEPNGVFGMYRPFGVYRSAEHLAERLRIRLDLSDQHKTEGG